MEDEIKSAFPNAIVQLIEGGGGVLEVTVDGHCVYSKKKETCRDFPRPGLVNERIREHLGN